MGLAIYVQYQAQRSLGPALNVTFKDQKKVCRGIETRRPANLFFSSNSTIYIVIFRFCFCQTRWLIHLSPGGKLWIAWTKVCCCWHEWPTFPNSNKHTIKGKFKSKQTFRLRFILSLRAWYMMEKELSDIMQYSNLMINSSKEREKITFCGPFFKRTRKVNWMSD